MDQKSVMPIHHEEAKWLSSQQYLTRTKKILAYLKKYCAKKKGNDQ